MLDLLCRLADHSEDELRTLAIAHMGNVIKELREWRPNVISRLVLFIVREIPDTLPATLESMLRILLQLITRWKECLLSENTLIQNSNVICGASQSSTSAAPSSKTSPLILPGNQSDNLPKSKSNSLKRDDVDLCVSSIRRVEGLALTILCHLRPNTRRLAVMLLKEAQSLANDLRLPELCAFVASIQKIDEGLPTVLEKMLPQLSSNERVRILCESTHKISCHLQISV